ncbi:MAG TPA: trimeric intracellular cation channel family protein [Elusimicrobiales bacterium]|nr:trimeric intracellular cation channel family protein [Elusimicrobiales bacterium]
MDKLHTVYYILELLGTFAFAISGATAAKERKLDLFGIFAIAFTVACGGGIVRDVCIGAIPPAGLTTWYYLATALLASGMAIGLYPVVQKLNRPVLLFDAAGLSLFAVTGTQKVLSFGFNGEAAVILGIITAVGGGVLRDMLLSRVPVILEKQIYASAALIGALIVVAGSYLTCVSSDWTALIALAVCFTLRLLSLHFHWNLPSFSSVKKRLTREQG